MSFLDDITAMTRFNGFPETSMRQTLFFSATFEGDIAKVADDLCRKDCVTIKNTTNAGNVRIQQRFIQVPLHERREYLLQMLNRGWIFLKKIK